MKIRFLIIMGIAFVGIAIGVLALQQNQEFKYPPPNTYPPTWKEKAIQNLAEQVMSAKTYDDKLDAIQKTINQTGLGEFSHIVLTGLKSDYSDGEKIKFNLTVFGYHNWCLFPNLSLYHEKYDKSIWESGISHHCPAPRDPPVPRVGNWKSDDFYRFPACRYEGMYTVMGESFEFGPKIIGKYYCHGSKEFHPPKTIQMNIPFGASDPNQQRNFEPSEISIDWGDIVNFTNNDDITHIIIGESEHTKLTDELEFYATLEPGQSFQMKMQNEGTNRIFSETIDNKRFSWMKGVIIVE